MMRRFAGIPLTVLFVIAPSAAQTDPLLPDQILKSA